MFHSILNVSKQRFVSLHVARTLYKNTLHIFFSEMWKTCKVDNDKRVDDMLVKKGSGILMRLKQRMIHITNYVCKIYREGHVVNIGIVVFGQQVMCGVK